MYAIETRGLSKTFKGIHAVNNLAMHVPQGSIYGFIGENGSGKSTTEKLICGLLVPERGSQIRLFGKPYTDSQVRANMGVLIESPGCFPGSSVYQNLYMQALNIGVRHPEQEVERVLKLTRMTGAAGQRFGKCSLGMKQRIGISQALLGRPQLLVLDEPINGLDADGMRIVRETLVRLNREEGVTILISSHILGELENSSHILGELEKIATHYGILREGTMMQELKASELDERCERFIEVHTANDTQAANLLSLAYSRIEIQEDCIRIYGEQDAERVSTALFQAGIPIRELATHKIGLEEYYLKAMKGGR